MTDQTVRRITSWFGIAGFVVFLAAMPLYFLGMESVARLEDAGSFATYIVSTHINQLVRSSLADPLIMICFLVFSAGLRHLAIRINPDFSWLATLSFGASILLVGIELVGDGLQAGAALDTTVKADPSVVRGLMEASFPFYGAIGLLVSALLLGSLGFLILATKVLRKWIACFAFGAAMLCVLMSPSILGGTDLTGFYTASGYAPFLGQGALLIWFLFASVSLLPKRE